MAIRESSVAVLRADTITVAPPPGDALVLIDGVVVDDAEFQRLRPGDIESISVSKAPDLSLYDNPRARNGVILVTTKEGASAL